MNRSQWFGRAVGTFLFALSFVVLPSFAHADTELPVDLCINIDGIQELVPGGFEIHEDLCVEIDVPDDICGNIPGLQETVPEGFESLNGTCTRIEEIIEDLCENLPDIQVTMPGGYVKIDGQCVPEPPPDNEEECEADGGIWDPVTETCNEDPTPEEECEASGGTWNGEMCIPGGGGEDPQEECEAGGGTWNEETQTCTPGGGGGGDDCDPGFHKEGDQCVPDDNGGGGNNGGNNGGNGGGGGGGGSNRSGGRDDDDGEVLGASSCGPIITSYIHPRWATNDSDNVRRLQIFLNDHFDLNLSVTGIYDQETQVAVHAFQRTYWEEVLKPWWTFPGSGIYDEDDSTGFVYITTSRMINNIACPELNLPIPPLI